MFLGSTRSAHAFRNDQNDTDRRMMLILCMYSMLSMGSLSSALANHPVIPVDPFLEPRTSNLYLPTRGTRKEEAKKQERLSASSNTFQTPLVLVQIPFNYQYTPTPHPDLKPEAYSPLTNSPHAYSTNYSTTGQPDFSDIRCSLWRVF